MQFISIGYSPYTHHLLISRDIQVGKSSYQSSDGLMKRSMEAKHLIEDTTSVFLFMATNPHVGRYPLGGCVFLLVFFDSHMLHGIGIFTYMYGKCRCIYSLHGASGIVQYCCCCCCCLFLVGGIIVRKNVVYSHPWWRDRCQIFKHHDLMMVISRKEGVKFSIWNLENTIYI